MKISKDVGAVYSAKYKIGISSKFFQHDLSKIDTSGLVGYKNETCEILDIFMEEEIFVIKAVLSPNISVKLHVYHIKCLIEEEMKKNNQNFTKPFFSTSYMCATLDSDFNVIEFRNAMKLSYRSKKGELL